MTSPPITLHLRPQQFSVLDLFRKVKKIRALASLNFHLSVNLLIQRNKGFCARYTFYMLDLMI